MMVHGLRTTSFFALFAAAACGGSTASSTVDASKPATDTGAQPDSGHLDAGHADAGHVDAGHADAGQHDTGIDTGTVDAGADVVAPHDSGVDAHGPTEDANVPKPDAERDAVADSHDANVVIPEGGAGFACTAGFQCDSLICEANGHCAAASCTDGIKNQNESDTDCGGVCSPCILGKMCNSGTDCASTDCTSNTCVAKSTFLNLPGTVTGASSVDSVDGKIIYLTAQDWSVYASANAGVTWTNVVPSIPQGSDRNFLAGQARIHVSRANAQDILVYAFTDTQTSTYDQGIIYSSTGLSNYSTATDAQSTWGSIAAFSDTDANTIYIFGDNGGSVVSTNAGVSFSAINPGPPNFPSLFTGVAAVIDPTNSAHAWLSYASSNAGPETIQSYDATNNNTTTITSAIQATLVQPPTGFELYSTGANAWRLRVIGASGAIATSDDLGASWQAVQTSASLSTCAQWASGERQIVSSPANRAKVASWCPKQGELDISSDGGKTWQSTGTSSCDISGVVVTATGAVVTCQSQPSIALSY